jgi:hypothetical protein
MSNWFKAALAAAILCQATAAQASVDTRTLAGAWEFRAVFEQIGCTITGGATITRTSTENVYDVALNAVQTCDGVTEAPVGQSCVARRVNDRVSIRCRIVQIDPGREYLPDDFELTVSDSGLMIGQLTANWYAPAIWRRRDTAPVS